MTYSLRGRLTTTTGLAAVVALGLGFLLLRALAAHMLVDEFRAGLETKARALGSLLSFDERGIHFDFAGELMPEYTAGHHDEFFQLWGPDGSLLELSENQTEPSFADRFVDRPDEWYEVRCWNAKLPDRRRGTCIGLTLLVDRRPGSYVPQDAPRPEVRLLLAQERETLEGRLSELTFRAVIACVVAIAAALLLMRRVLRRGLAPLERMVEQISATGRGADADREGVSTDGLPRELEICASKVNELVERLSAAAEEQKRVANGLGHELRTPIATLRSATDLVQRWPEDEQLKANALRIAGDVAAYLSRTISALLRFGRLREGEPLELAPVQVVGFVREVAGRFEEQARERGLVIRDESLVSTSFSMVTDEAILGLALSNLVENATRYSPEGERVALRIELLPDQEVGIRVSNRAPELVQGDLPKLCEPFWQLDASRSSKHAGLGLSLVLGLVEALGGRLDLKLEKGWLHVEMILPTASRMQPQAVA